MILLKLFIRLSLTSSASFSGETDETFIRWAFFVFLHQTRTLSARMFALLTSFFLIVADIQNMTHQQLLTPKVEVTETFDGKSDFTSNEATPESSRISTPDSVLNNNNNTSTCSTSTIAMNAPTNRPTKQRRIRRRATSQCQDPAEQLTEMSVRGLNLFRYASITEGIYQCTECAKLDVTKTFKNKYSFQRHAFLYHEGQQRKVFPCPVCSKEFSRPDKMKNHMKTVHDCFMPKVEVSDVVFPPVSMGFFPTM
ncbi:hypothetical protein HUJ04_005848 [Dendroctonus ponderosae]|nr:hypothetical protein HUJ04_005848 [Dendroctonus ponderosae]